MDMDKQRRKEKETNLQDRKSKLAISDDFLNELLKYDFTSSKKGRGFSSLLIERQSKKDKEQNL